MNQKELAYLEELVGNIKMEGMTGNHGNDMRAMSRVLKRVFDLDIDFRIFNNKTNNFIGMSVYPTVDTIDQLVTSLVRPRTRVQEIEAIWAKTPSWVIEMDSLFLFDPFINSNPREIVAVLLHEIGHIVYSNKVPQRLHKVFRYSIMKSSFNLKRLVQWKRAQKILNFAILQACESKSFHPIPVNPEVEADRFVVKAGYGDALNAFITKLLNTQGNDLLSRTEAELDRDVRAMVSWSLDNIQELEFRKTKLRSMLQTQMLQNPSVFCRQVVAQIKEAFFGDDDLEDNPVKEAYNIPLMKAMESWEAKKLKIIEEGLKSLFDRYGRVKKMSQSEIDLIAVEIGRIQTHDDKIFVLDLIYDKLDEVNIATDLINDKRQDRVPMSKDTLKRFRAQLEELRKQTLAVEIQEEQFGLFVRYPKGYEG